VFKMFSHYLIDQHSDLITGHRISYTKSNSSSIFEKNLRYLLNNIRNYPDQVSEENYAIFNSFYDSSLNKNLFPYSIILGRDKSFSSSLSDFYQSFYTSKFTNTPTSLNPIAVRYIDSSGNYYIERPPFQVEIDFSVTFNKKKKMSPAKIWIPWTVAVVNPSSLNDTYFYFSSSSLFSEETKYIVCPLPNIYADARVCFANSLNSLPLDNSDQDFRYKYSAIINEYFAGGWNLDLSSSLTSFVNSFLTSMKYDRINKEDFPTLFKFFTPTSQEISFHNPGLSKSTIRSLLNSTDKLYYSENRSYFFKYFFYILSTFSLSETLSFYEEIHKYYSFINVEKPFLHTFSSILTKHRDTYASASRRLNYSIPASFSHYAANQSSYQYFDPFFEQHNILFYYTFTLNQPISRFSFQPSSFFSTFDSHIYHKIYSLIDSSSYSPDRNYISITSPHINFLDGSYDASSFSVSLETIPPSHTSFDSFYSSLIPEPLLSPDFTSNSLFSQPL